MPVSLPKLPKVDLSKPPLEAEELQDLLDDYRNCKKWIGSGSPAKRVEALNGMVNALIWICEYPLPFAVGDRCSCNDLGEGTVIFVGSGCVTVAFDDNITYVAFNAYQAHTQLNPL